MSQMLTWFRSGLAAIALVLFSAAITMIWDHRKLGIYLFLAAFEIGLILVIVYLVAQHRFRTIRDGLRELLTESNELTYRVVSTQEQFQQWKADMNGWVYRAKDFLTEKLSSTHAAIFLDLSEGGRYHIRGAFNSEHGDLINVLGKYVRNLKGISSRYLRVNNE
jgi:hypothetical protein